MSSLEIANNNCVITITPNGTWTPSTPTYTKDVSTKLKADGVGCLKTSVSWTITECVFTGPPYLGGVGSGSGSISGTSTKLKESSDVFMRKNDSGECNGIINVIQPSGPPVPTPCNCTYQITNAGQSKLKSV